MKTIAIKISNPARVARNFGECAGDYSNQECNWWVGTHRELYPSAVLPEGAVVVSAPVVVCGASAYVHHSDRAHLREIAERRGSSGYGYGWQLGWAKVRHADLIDCRSRGWKVTPKDFAPCSTAWTGFQA